MSKRLTTDEFIIKAKEIHGDKYDYSLVDYVNTISKVEIICPTHGVFEQTPNAHLLKQGCPKCRKNNKLNTSEFIKKAKKIHKNKFDYSLVEYVGTDININIICKKHGIFEQTPHTHLTGCGCPQCANNIKYDNNMFIEKAINIHGYKFDYSMVEYKTNKTKVKIICPFHGIFEQTPNNHFKYGCLSCKSSNGEEKIEKYLENKKISYKKEYKFEKCKHEKKLLFDFYLSDYNICIEYDGEQHFRPIKHFGGNESFLKTKKRDQIKNKYCEDNNIKLLRIPYTEFDNVENILEKELNNFF